MSLVSQLEQSSPSRCTVLFSTKWLCRSFVEWAFEVGQPPCFGTRGNATCFLSFTKGSFSTTIALFITNTDNRDFELWPHTRPLPHALFLLLSAYPLSCFLHEHNLPSTRGRPKRFHLFQAQHASTHNRILPEWLQQFIHSTASTFPKVLDIYILDT